MSSARLIGLVWLRVGAACLGAALLLAPSPARATLFPLIDGNSTAVVDTAAGGVVGWAVDGVQHVGKGQMSWFYRIGSGPEAPLGALNLVSENAFGPNNQNNGVVAVYSDPGQSFTLTLLQSLGGGAPGSGQSAIVVQLSATSTSSQPVDLHLFEYNDLDLTGSAANDVATIQPLQGAATTLQSDAAPTFFMQDISGGSLAAMRGPSHFSVDNAANLLAPLNDGLATTLDDVATRPTTDAAFAYQFDVTLAPQGTDPPAEQYFIIVNKRLESQVTSGARVPEPMTITLAGLGLWALSLGAARRRSQ